MMPWAGAGPGAVSQGTRQEGTDAATLLGLLAPRHRHLSQGSSLTTAQGTATMSSFPSPCPVSDLNVNLNLRL